MVRRTKRASTQAVDEESEAIKVKKPPRRKRKMSQDSTEDVQASSKIMKKQKKETENTTEKSVPKTKKSRKPAATVKKALKRKTGSLLEADKQTDVEVKVKVEPQTDEKKAVETQAAGLRKQKNKNVKLVGAHCSISGGLENAIFEAVDMGAHAIGMFLKSQRTWACKPLEEKAAVKFRQAMQDHGFAPHQIVPHGSYLMNCGSPNPEALEKSRAALVDELQRCEKLGLTLFNFHPGSTCGKISREEGISRIAESINRAHQKTKYVTAVLENMCCQGNTIGGDFNELAQIIDKVEDKSRVGVCLDTCHAFAAGFNLKTKEGYEKMMDDFENIIGLKYLKAVHVNDSKGDCGCHLDRHENIGKGQIGMEGFNRIMNDSRFDNIPFVLETPEGDYAREIKMLYSLYKP